MKIILPFSMAFAVVVYTIMNVLQYLDETLPEEARIFLVLMIWGAMLGSFALAVAANEVRR